MGGCTLAQKYMTLLSAASASAPATASSISRSPLRIDARDLTCPPALPPVFCLPSAPPPGGVSSSRLPFCRCLAFHTPVICHSPVPSLRLHSFSSGLSLSQCYSLLICCSFSFPLSIYRYLSLFFLLLLRLRLLLFLLLSVPIPIPFPFPLPPSLSISRPSSHLPFFLLSPSHPPPFLPSLPFPPSLLPFFLLPSSSPLPRH